MLLRAHAPPHGRASKARIVARSFPPLSPIRGDPLTFWPFSLQTREQLQADLLRCQAKIEDLEKLLVEKGQVRRTSERAALCVSVPSWCPRGLGAGGRGTPSTVCVGLLQRH